MIRSLLCNLDKIRQKITEAKNDLETHIYKMEDDLLTEWFQTYADAEEIESLKSWV
jgi:hypothetical protein